jgi:succinylglutamate desuccinylase
MTNQSRRIIGTYEGSQKGPLVMVFGAMHGNEPAGVHALEEIFRLLNIEPQANPNFEFKGKIVGFLGNLRAFAEGQRFQNHDLNRAWTLANIERIAMATAPLEHEDRELAELLSAMQIEIKDYQPTQLVLLDLHTTSAQGGVFCIPTEGHASLDFAQNLCAPVILGLLDGVQGTLLQFAAEGLLSDVPTLAAAFEAGQHADPDSVSRSVAAIVHCLRAAGCISPADVDSRHELVLTHNNTGLPRVTRLFYVHRIEPNDAFRMRPGYVNFQRVAADEHLADDRTGPVLSPDNGLILMPLYQPKGADGFFLVREIEGSVG